MTKALYPKTKARWIQGLDSVLAGTIKGLLIDTTEYTYDAAHAFLSDVPEIARLAISEGLTNRAVDADTGAFNSDNPVFLGVEEIVGAVGLFFDTGDAATSRLIMYQDEDVTGLPYDPTYDEPNVRVLVHEDGWFII